MSADSYKEFPIGQAVTFKEPSRIIHGFVIEHCVDEDGRIAVKVEWVDAHIGWGNENKIRVTIVPIWNKRLKASNVTLYHVRS